MQVIEKHFRFENYLPRIFFYLWSPQDLLCMYLFYLFIAYFIAVACPTLSQNADFPNLSDLF